ncbi:hypothetical protein IAU59_007362 [Kwoniella sp. CBS 9459]
MNDPLSPLVAPPPRYLLESDSSDEEGQGEYPHLEHGSSRPRPKVRTRRHITLDVNARSGEGSAGEDEEVFVGLGQVGRYLSKITGTTSAGSRGSSSGSQSDVYGQIKVDDDVIGRIMIIGNDTGSGSGSKLVSLEESDLSGEEVWEVVKLLKEKIRAKNWSVLTSYVPSMYIPSPSESTVSGTQHTEPPIRVFPSSSSSSEIERSGLSGQVTYSFDAPNYLTGVAAAFVSLSTHPSSSFPSPRTLILPLPLSSIPITTLAEALPSSVLGETLKGIASQARGKSSSLASSRWTEDDDEPFSAYGMGKVKGVKRGVGEAASMYT